MPYPTGLARDEQRQRELNCLAYVEAGAWTLLLWETVTHLVVFGCLSLSLVGEGRKEGTTKNAKLLFKQVAVSIKCVVTI